MKPILLTWFVLSLISAKSQHFLQKIWETDSVVAVPESVCPDLRQKMLYVSLIDGDSWGADGKGGVATLSVLLDRENNHMNTADIAYDALTKTLFVPTFFAKKIIAYKV